MTIPPAPAGPLSATRTVLVARICHVLETIRAERPRVHAITSPVAQPLSANGLLALGAIPSLTVFRDETPAFVEASAALLLNLGMMDGERFAAIPRAAEAACEAGKPFVLDPVFAERSPVRQALAVSLLAKTPAIAKFNTSEAQTFRPHVGASTVMVVTGAEDTITRGDNLVVLGNGHPWLAGVTATGCLLGAILAACLAVERDPFHAAIAGVSLLNIAAEQAAGRSSGPGTFAVNLIDALAALDREAIEAHFNLREYRNHAAR